MSNGLIFDIYRDSSRGDCTNGGISSRVTRGTLVGSGIAGVFEPTPEAPEFKLVTRLICGEEYRHIEPSDPSPNGRYMFGGNLAYSSDSRFPNEYPLKIHDRVE